MKVYIASDIHGNAKAAKALTDAFIVGGGDKLVILGDFYNHGPRNPIQDGYWPMKTAAILNAVKDKIVAIKGNCDSEVDEMISDFDFYKSYTMTSDGVTCFFTHGHVCNLNNPPELPEGSIVFHGHFHQHTDAEKDGIRFLNPGSIGIPFDGDRGYFVMQDGLIEWFPIEL